MWMLSEEPIGSWPGGHRTQNYLNNMMFLFSSRTIVFIEEHTVLLYYIINRNWESTAEPEFILWYHKFKEFPHLQIL